MKKTLNRRQFLKYGGAGFAGISLSALNLPIFRLKKASASVSDTAWQFGVMADTQWKTGGSAGGEPNSCAASVIDALNEQFIQHDCKFVIQVGDLVDRESVSGVRTLPTREEHTQALYNAGIGFFPLRGNHEASATAAREMPDLFPQMLGNGPNLFDATNFQSPDIAGLNGLTYAFDHENIRCVMIDQFVRADGSNFDGTSSYNNNALDQVEWVDEMLSSNLSGNHAFVFAHKNLIGQNHKDNLFGRDLTSNPEKRDEFISSLCNNGVRYYLGGHDHMHHRSLVTTGNGYSSVGQIICSSNSYKFYTPRPGDDGRETPLDHELWTIGYYIFTIDGPRVTVDFYSSNHGQDYGSVSLIIPPSLTFYLRESFGYSLNGDQFEVAQGESYTGVVGSYKGTTARILSGENNNFETDYLDRPLIKTINTGWLDSEQVEGAASQIFTLWGMADNLSLYEDTLDGPLPDEAESQETDIYTLSIKYNPRKIRPSQLMRGDFVLAARDIENDGEWTNAVDLNSGGSKNFKRGAWRAGYGLGNYGVDPRTATVWAVINHESDFVAKLI